MERLAIIAVVLLMAWASASVVSADPIGQHSKGEPVAFVVPAGQIEFLASECLADEERVFTSGGMPFWSRWNADHDRITFRMTPRGERVVFDGAAFHNHGHNPVVAYVECGR